MEASRNWRVVIAAIAVVDIILIAAIAYVALREDEEEEILDMAVIRISGSDLPDSKLVDHGSETASDPYVITGLDVELRQATHSLNYYGMMVSNVNCHLIIS